MSIVKIVLDASALQLLMDKNPKFEVAVNQAALAWLRKAIIKPVTDDKIQKALFAAKRELSQYFEKKFKDTYAVQKWPYSLSKDFRERIYEIGNDMVESIIKENLKKKINAENLEAEFRLEMDKILDDFRDTAVRNYTSGKVQQLVRDIINNKMTAILDKIQG
jgi:hypothetical protein